MPHCTQVCTKMLISSHLRSGLCVQASFVITEGMTFEQYLSLTLPEDEINEIPLSLKAMQGTIKEKEKTTGLTPEEQVRIMITGYHHVPVQFFSSLSPCCSCKHSPCMKLSSMTVQTCIL